MRLRLAIALLGCASAVGCGALSGLIPPQECVSDAECRGGLVCFPDGCGDPGTGIVVEVTGDTTNLHAQDFAVPAGATATMNLDLRGPLPLTGTLEKQTEDNSGTLPYTDGITITANGESDLLPGKFRTYSLVLPRTEQGGYQMSIGAGTYSVTARSHDVSIPLDSKRVTAGPGLTAGASFVFPSLKQRLALTGRLVKTAMPLVEQAGMTIQAFETVGGKPLSQVATVSNGTFWLYLGEGSSFRDSITFVARPSSSTALVPTKTFVISPVPPSQTFLGMLELGDFGDAPMAASGKLLAEDGAPVVGAIVSFEGRVGGGGTFESRKVVTDSTGTFSVDLLASPRDAAYTMTAIPPPGSRAGILTAQVRVGLTMEGKVALFAGTEVKTTFTCPDRLVISGEVLGVEGLPAFDVQVEANPLEALDQRPLPHEVTRTTTDAQGRFELLLDPARYRIDYIPPKGLPRKSRVVRFEPTVSPDAGEVLKTSDLGPFQLTKGRTVSGVVTVRPNSLDLPDGGTTMAHVPGAPVNNALVRFYRVTSVEGMSSSLLIGETYTDSRGGYSVVLPDYLPATR